MTAASLPILASGVGVDWTTFVAQVVNFLILVWLLKRFLYGPIVRAMDDRERGIAERLDEAAREHEAAEAERSTHATLVAEHRRRLDEMILEARAEADEVRGRLLAQVQEETERRRAEWEESFARERRRSLETVADSIEEMVHDGVSRVLRELADVDLEERVVEVFLRRLGEVELPFVPGELTVRTTFPLGPELRSRVESELTCAVHDGRNVGFETVEGPCGISVGNGGRAVEWTIASVLDDLLGPDEELRTIGESGVDVLVGERTT